ncbi:MAG: metallophosphoesterase family protein [Bacteroides sp.]
MKSLAKKAKIYITGDCHGDYARFSKQRFPEQENMTRDDFVIILGDFGYWDNSPEQVYQRSWLSELPFTLLFVDGNHENYDMLDALPVESWMGGKIQKISENIFHLMRGEIFDIGGLRFFAMGGAASHDIQDGILDPNDKSFKRKKAALDRRFGMYRVLGRSWWARELPNEVEYARAERNLNAVNNEVDYILSHDCSTQIMDIIGRGMYVPSKLNDWFQKNIEEKVNYRQWLFGHHHDNRIIGKHVMLYKQIVKMQR